MNTKPILFIDFFKTLNHEVYWRSLPSAEKEKIQQLLFRNNTTLVNDWMRGKHSAEDVNRIAAEKLNIPYEHLWEVFVRDCKTMKIPITTLETINQLRHKYFTILLTGNMDSFSRFTQPALHLDNYFDLISNSFNEGLHKTDNEGELFLKYTRLYNAKIQDCVLLDDSKQVYETFSKLGGIAYLITPEKTISFYLKQLS